MKLFSIIKPVGPVNGGFQKKHDIILFYNKGHKYTFNFNDVMVSRSEKSLKRAQNPKGARISANEVNKMATDVWTDIQALNPMAKERVGYPTQKPLALLERIIAASSNERGIILDPFCGCATTCIAAEALNRQWIGIDISPMAVNLLETRIYENYELELGGKLVRSHINHRTDIPVRDAPPRSRDIKHILFGQQEGLCKGCKTAFPYSNFTIDHIVPKAKGGPDTDDNLQLLCNYCNSVKGDRTMEYLIKHSAKKK